MPEKVSETENRLWKYILSKISNFYEKYTQHSVQ
jgi:hypothetical protein